ncbi:MAG: endolytic transglycosylase MltG [Fimbriimonadaceae bacterium]
MSKIWRNVGLAVVGIVGGSVGGAYYYVSSGIAPEPKGPPRYVRYTTSKKLSAVAKDLQDKGVIRSANALGWYARYVKKQTPIASGTYSVFPGMTADEVLATLQKPIRNMFRVPETNMSFRTANLLAKAEISTAEEYKDLIKRPSEFAGVIKMPLPSDTLEGYLYPDTYDFPPLMGAREVIVRQLQNFEKKVAGLKIPPAKLRPILTIASMVELEAGVDKERAMIAGVIYNRLKKGMRLQIDATVLFGLGEWRRLYNKDYTSTQSPYNTYVVDGLPPGPICSPSLKSIVAAMNPTRHNYIYYVAKPDMTSLFAMTYPEHLRNIAIARKLRAAAGR